MYQEVQDFQPRPGRAGLSPRSWCSRPAPSRVLNGKSTEFRLKEHRQIDWKPQFDKAIDAFGRNGFFILIDDKQAEDLDHEFVIGHGTVMSFVRLTPLVGG